MSKRMTRQQTKALKEAESQIISPYLSFDEICKGVKVLKQYVDKSTAMRENKKKDLLGDDDNQKVIIEIVFKNVPSIKRTFIHNISLPHHWRTQTEPEALSIALFVRHRKAQSEAEAIQFKRDRDLDVQNTHNYYKQLFGANLDENLRHRITKLISVKELATEYNTFEKIERLSKSYDLFMADKILMSGKLNPLPRRLGRRFWVKEKKVPIMVRLNDPATLNERFKHALSVEPFYVGGRSSSEHIQIGVLGQSDKHLAENIVAFFVKLNSLYGDKIRFIKVRSTYGISLPIYADLNAYCPEIVMNKKRKRGHKTYVSDFDLLPNNKKVVIEPDATVRVLTVQRPTKTR